MAQPDAENVVVGVTGAIYIADVGTTLPTQATGTPNVAFEELGYVSDAGIQENPATTSTTNIKAWQNGVVVRKVQTEHDTTYVFSLIESTPGSLEAFYGNYDDGLVEINAAIMPKKAWVIDIDDGASRVRHVIPNAQITQRGAVSFVNGGAAMYPITLTAYEDPDYAGALDTPAKVYKYHSTVGAPSA